MRYPEFKRQLTDYCSAELQEDPERGLYVVQALGRTSSHERLELNTAMELGASGIPEPFVAIVSSIETPQARRYGLFVANSAYREYPHSPYPVLGIDCKTRIPRTTSEEQVAALGDTVFLETDDERLERQVRLWFVNGYQDSLMFNGVPTSSALMCQVIDALQE